MRRAMAGVRNSIWREKDVWQNPETVPFIYCWENCPETVQVGWLRPAVNECDPYSKLPNNCHVQWRSVTAARTHPLRSALKASSDSYSDPTLSQIHSLRSALPECDPQSDFSEIFWTCIESHSIPKHYTAIILVLIHVVTCLTERPCRIHVVIGVHCCILSWLASSNTRHDPIQHRRCDPITLYQFLCLNIQY
jgi:hypothetical protein